MKRYYRYFGGFISTQEKWLNQVASNGYRLVKSENLLYQFEHSNDAYKYYVDFVADLSQQNSEAYKAFLEEMDYKVFYKNMNLCYSIGKIRYRPWAEKGGHIVTAKNNFNKELLIVEAKTMNIPLNCILAWKTGLDTFSGWQRCGGICL